MASTTLPLAVTFIHSSRWCRSWKIVDLPNIIPCCLFDSNFSSCRWLTMWSWTNLSIVLHKIADGVSFQIDGLYLMVSFLKDVSSFRLSGSQCSAERRSIGFHDLFFPRGRKWTYSPAFLHLLIPGLTMRARHCHVSLLVCSHADKGRNLVLLRWIGPQLYCLPAPLPMSTSELLCSWSHQPGMHGSTFSRAPTRSTDWDLHYFHQRNH